MANIVQILGNNTDGGVLWANPTSTGGTVLITGTVDSLNFEAVNTASSASFSAYLASGVSNVTGAGTTWTLGSGTALTEIFDNGGVFNTNGTFTAPSSSKYQLQAQVTVSGITALMTSAIIDIVTTSATYRYTVNPSSLLGGSLTLPITAFVTMSANDTATVQVTLSGNLTDAADIVGGATIQTWFSGYKVL